jgi:D-glycero-D-manno-heptose 1,7-bisphosphate phosphatase
MSDIGNYAMATPLLILDRDGVINEDSDDFIKSPDEWVPIPGSLEAIARANRAGYRVAVVTNQSGIARGKLGLADLQRIHEKMGRQLEAVGGKLEAIVFCPHAPEDHCDCRKPRPGMFHEIASRLGASLTDVPVVGDRWADIEAARTIGATPILVRTGKGQRTMDNGHDLTDVAVYQDLSTFIDHLLTP